MSQFSPYYAYPMMYPYPQYLRPDTYPGNSVLAVSGPKQIFGQGAGLFISLLLAVAGGVAGFFWKKTWIAAALGGLGGFVLGRFGAVLFGKPKFKQPGIDPRAFGRAFAQPQQELDQQIQKQWAQQQAQQQQQQAQQQPQQWAQQQEQAPQISMQKPQSSKIKPPQGKQGPPLSKWNKDKAQKALRRFLAAAFAESQAHPGDKEKVAWFIDELCANVSGYGTLSDDGRQGDARWIAGALNMKITEADALAKLMIQYLKEEGCANTVKLLAKEIAEEMQQQQQQQQLFQQPQQQYQQQQQQVQQQQQYPQQQQVQQQQQQVQQQLNTQQIQQAQTLITQGPPYSDQQLQLLFAYKQYLQAHPQLGQSLQITTQPGCVGPT